MLPAYLAEIMCERDDLDRIWGIEFRAALSRTARLVPVAAWLRWETVESYRMAPTEIAAAVAARVDEGHLFGIVLSPTLASALRRQRGLRQPLQCAVLDIQLVHVDDASLPHSQSSAPSDDAYGLRVDISDDPLARPWRRVRLPLAMRSDDRAALDHAISSWLVDLYRKAVSNSGARRVSVRTLLTAIEALLTEVERLRLNEAALRRVLANNEEEISRLRDKLQAASLALRAESTRTEPDRGELRLLIKWLGSLLAVALASGAGSYGGALAAPDRSPIPSEAIHAMADDPDLAPLGAALDQAERYCGDLDD